MMVGDLVTGLEIGLILAVVFLAGFCVYLYRYYSQRSIQFSILESQTGDLKESLETYKNKAESFDLEIRELEARNTQLETTLKEREESFQREKRSFQEQKEELEKSFGSLANKALESNVDQFLKLATERLDRKSVEHKHSLSEKTEEFQKLVSPIKDLMSKLENDFSKVEKQRIEQFTAINEQLKSVGVASEALRKEASSLTTALRRPEVRGSWGELQLRRVVELAGMSQYCDFEEQVSVRKDDQLQKPDMLVKLPNSRSIVIDSKAVLDAYLDAAEAENPEDRKVALERHAKNLRSRVRELSRKSYWEQFESAPDFVVLFVPNEALLQAAVEVDKNILEDALKEKIIVATPTTLVALLKAVAYGWQQESVAANAMQIIESSKELYERVVQWVKKLSDVGTKLQSTTKVYNEAVGSLERRVLPSARRMKELGLSELSDVPNLNEVDLNTREIKAPEADKVD
ncbi:MAG: DNA recombination protein RmuC [Bdellovibrionaceae bacterium]|nr:DNA recombination protein RmuC [Pseudobdellovibrionaceae bacterium]|tara:strand:+ start:12389 stop:13771 length:1383 start_codon:yes stop_codon:yes gene_type:complete